MKQKYIINPRYVLRNETNKIILLMRPDANDESTINVIHPVYAMILSFVDGNTIEEAANMASEFLKMKKEKIVEILTLLKENINPIKGFETVFPTKMLVRFKKGMKNRNYKPNDFNCSSLDLNLSRLKYPADIICNLTLKCKTSCVYCYADRANKQQYKLTPEKILCIIDEAYKLGVVSFKLMGGDIFTYRGWDIILERLNSYDYYPCISTKIPLLEKDVIKLKRLLNRENPIQISLDSFIPEHISQILQVDGNSYLKKMATFINLLETYKIDYTVHTVLCSINDNVQDMESIEEFVCGKKHLKEWFIDSAKCSMYLPYPYEKYKPKRENVILIREYINENRNKFSKLRIHVPQIVRNHNKLKKDLKEKIFKNRIPCSGNLSSMYILPDGKVTVCEELYWHPKFILGDLNSNSIEEIWSSKKANNLFYLQKHSVSNDSACKKCKDFEDCRSYKHVCWRDVILAYGKDHWDFPDPFCPKAPMVSADISME